MKHQKELVSFLGNLSDKIPGKSNNKYCRKAIILAEDMDFNESKDKNSLKYFYPKSFFAQEDGSINVEHKKELYPMHQYSNEKATLLDMNEEESQSEKNENHFHKENPFELDSLQKTSNNKEKFNKLDESSEVNSMSKMTIKNINNNEKDNLVTTKKINEVSKTTLPNNTLNQLQIWKADKKDGQEKIEKRMSG